GRQQLRDRLRRRGLAPDPHRPEAPERSSTALISPGLVGSTASAAARFASIPAAVPGGAATSLALGVLRAMAMTQWWQAGAVRRVLGASTSGVVSVAWRNAAVAQAAREDPPEAIAGNDIAVIEVKPGKLSRVIKERGNLEATHATNVICTVDLGSRK